VAKRFSFDHKSLLRQGLHQGCDQEAYSNQLLDKANRHDHGTTEILEALVFVNII
jgi:hypothetical protein